MSKPEETVPVLKAYALAEEPRKILTQHFQEKFNIKPTFYCRVPGRVNLIGDHVDYSGYAVCPMAIEQCIILAVAVSNDGQIRLTNMDKKYEDFQCSVDSIEEYMACIVSSTIGAVGEGPAWYKYFLCGVKGMLDHFPMEHISGGFTVAVWSNIPSNSGLSSSSALVSAAALATMYISPRRFRKYDIADASAIAERYIGTQGGGMDQAIAFLGKAGSAQLIEFNPISATDVTLPENAVFVIAHSLAYHNNAATTHYNLRVAECRLAAQVLAKKNGKEWRHVFRLCDIQKSLDYDLPKMAEVVKSCLHDKPYTLDEVCECLNITQDELKSIVPMISTFGSTQTFKLKQRAWHVFEEAYRVTMFRIITEKTSVPDNVKIQLLGDLMRESHVSLQKLYECSHPRVDALVDMAKECGALGARVTGAGWGGCVVILVARDRVSEFVKRLRNDWRLRQEGDCPDLENLVFPTEPHQGAAIYLP